MSRSSLSAVSRHSFPGAGTACALIAALGLFLVPSVGHGADAERGRALYETRCDLCHGVSVHAREVRRATTFDELRRQVARWNGELGGVWSAEDIDAVSAYLNRLYYRLPCPEHVCTVGKSAGQLPAAVAGK